jgi:serine/threonine protein kinase
MVGQTVAHYKILDHIGSGGMGVVYKAEDTRLKRSVALKFLPPEFTQDQSTRERFFHEAQAASALEHVNICSVHELGEHDGQTFLVMGFYEGETLKQKIEHGPMPIEAVLDVAVQTAGGLSRAHEAGIIHRDIKPANLIVTTRGEVKILDFGLAKLGGRTLLTKSGSTLGTAAYMSPEQARGESVDHRTDIWSLGVLMYEMIASRRPFGSDYEQALIYQILNTEPEPLTKVRPETLPGLAEIVAHALAKQPAERYQSMEEFRDDLVAVAEGLKPLKAKPLVDHPEKSIAVLPFINDSPDQENTYFINGVMEEILNNLQKIRALRVISRTSVEQYRDKRKPLREIARELGVNYIVEGSAQKYGNAFRLRAQLILAEHESHLWGESFQQKITEVEDIFNLQIKIAESIAEELKAVISPQERKLIEKIPEADLSVYDEYLKARSHVYDGGREALYEAVEFLNSGVVKNPGWAPLYAGLAEAWMWIQQSGLEPPSVTGPRIVENLNKALELNPDLAGAHYLSALIAQLVDWNWEKSEKEFLRALAINPNDALSRGLYAQLLLIQQRKDEAMAQNELALSLDPMNPIMKLTNIGTLLQAGEYQTGLALAEEAVADDSDNVNLNQMIEIAAYRLKQYDKVLRAVRCLLRSYIEEDAFRDIERTYSESGIAAAYKKIVEHLEKYAESHPVSFFDLAFRYLVAGQLDKCMDWVEKGYEMHDPLMTYNTTPARYFDALFGNPRFIAICQKMNLTIPKSE